jgi:hypothetical protein
MERPTDNHIGSRRMVIEHDYPRRTFDDTDRKRTRPASVRASLKASSLRVGSMAANPFNVRID